MTKRKKAGIIGLLVPGLVLLGTLAQAQVPQLINYQGVLKTSSGTPVAGPVNLTFAIYDVASGPNAPLWTETQNGVSVANGLFNVLLGSTTALPGNLFQNTNRWLGVRVGTDAEMTPRQQLVSVAYSFLAADADTVGAGGVTVNRADNSLDVVVKDGLVRLSNTTANNTLKAGRLVVRNYNNAALPIYAFGSASTATNNFIAYGGGADIGYAATQLDFFTAPNTTTTIGFPRIRVNGDGKVGIGTTAPAELLHVNGNVRANAFLTTSSRAFKKEITPLEGKDYQDILGQINRIQLVRFLYTDEDHRQPHLGVIAEDSPRQILDPTGKAVSLADYTSFLLAGLKAQAAQIEELKAQVKALQARLPADHTP